MKADADKKEAEDKAEEEKRNKNKSLVCETGEFKESEKHIVQEESVADYFKRKMALRMAALESKGDVSCIYKFFRKKSLFTWNS